MKPALAQAYDRLMDRAGTTALLAALADTGPGRTLPITDLLQAVSALGGPSRLGPLRDQLMALQPLLLRMDPGTDEEQVGFRHPEIAARARARRSDAGVTTGNDPHYAVADLWLLLDGEAEAGTEMREHLEECASCLETFAGLERLKLKVARCAGGEHAPPELRTRIVASVRQTVESAAGPTLPTSARRSSPGPP
ncbi:hypothetical protein [Amycolatopsis sp. NPDC051128]|uniref:hypothetical protein n=1 Tax=Amycolatopsis sp. NPDC051128 TaxID=3155412 RepID=UPI0034390C10